MKKTFLGMLVGSAMLLGMASCTQSHRVEPNHQKSGIAFRPFVSNSVRAADMDRDGLKTDGFNVSAIGNNAMFFEDVNVKPENASALDQFWLTQNDTYYWPTYELDFVAWANLGSYGTKTVNTTAQTIALETPTTVANQVDVIVARDKGDRATNEASGMPLNFKHILSQVEVKAKNTNANYTVKVAGIKIGRINSKSTFTYPADTKTATTLAHSQYNSNTPASFGAGSASEVTLNGTEQSVMNATNGNFRLIPQALTAWNQKEQHENNVADNAGTYLGVLVNITNKSGAAIYPTTAGEYAFAAVPLSLTSGFEAGKKYIITLDFSEGCGFEEPVIGQGNPTDLPTGVTINGTPVTPGTDKPGRPILGGPIKFTVTVEGWSDVAVTDLSLKPQP